MSRRVLIVHWDGSAYDSLRGLLRLAGAELERQGFAIVELAYGAPGWDRELTGILAEGDLVFAMGMSGVGSDILTADKALVWEAAKVPFFDWNCDHPCYYPSRHQLRSRFLLHGYVFPDHARYSLRHFNANGASFAVHIGLPPADLFLVPAEGRNGRILFTKSGADIAPIEARWRAAPAPLAALLPRAAEALFHRPTTDFLPILNQVAADQGIVLDGNGELAMTLIRELDAYIRFKRANMVMAVALDYPVDVFGNGWDHIGRAGMRAQLAGPVGWEQTLGMLPRYTACLSVNPLIDESVHDRVFFALAAGVTPVSDANAFWRARLPALAPYGFGFSADQIRAAIEAVLSDPVAAAERTAQARDALGEAFTLRYAVRQIMAFVSLHGMNARCAP